MHKKKIRVIICDDHPGMRKILSQHLEAQNEVSLVGVCKTGLEAISQTLKLVPDILFVDINMPPPDGLSVTQQINKSDIATKVIGFSILNTSSIAKKMIEAGAWGYITKTSPPEEIMIAIRQVMAGKKYLCDEITKAGNN